MTPVVENAEVETATGGTIGPREPKNRHANRTSPSDARMRLGDTLTLTQDLAPSVAVDFLAEAARTLGRIPAQPIDDAIDLLLRARSTGQRVFVIGNGGSAATASHFVCDLVKSAEVSGFDPLRAFSLSDNIPLLTAWGNDASYSRVFAEQVRALADEGDVLIAISASGNSPNIVAGLSAALAKGVRTIGLLGFDGGAALDLVDIAIHVPSHDYGVVEAAHGAVAHAITFAMSRRLREDPFALTLGRAPHKCETTLSSTLSC
jgi:D-sedoheptulose 7-phosphate isomerase